MGRSGCAFGNTAGAKIILIMQSLTIIKIGGNIVDDEPSLSLFLSAFAKINGNKILVHGGGKLATKIAEAMGIQQEMIDGRRITDAETLKIVTMVYAGAINKNIVAQLQQHQCNAIGLSGADGNIMKAHQRAVVSAEGASIDYGFVGDIDSVNSTFIQQLLDLQFIPVISPITHNGNGQLLNTNADTIAQTLATALASMYTITLIYSFEKAGVLLDVHNDHSVIPTITPSYYQQLKLQQRIFAGMIPKLDNAFAAIHQGVSKVIIGNANQLDSLLNEHSGTTILND